MRMCHEGEQTTELMFGANQTDPVFLAGGLDIYSRLCITGSGNLHGKPFMLKLRLGLASGRF